MVHRAPVVLGVSARVDTVPVRAATAFERRKVDEAVLPTLVQVDAALGVLTGVLALEGTHSIVGDPDEGLILQPVKHLPESPLWLIAGLWGSKSLKSERDVSHWALDRASRLSNAHTHKDCLHCNPKSGGGGE